MRASHRLTVSLVVVVAVVQGLLAWSSVRRETALYDRARARLLESLARVLVDPAAQAQDSAGDEGVLALARNADELLPELGVRIVWLDASTGEAPLADPLRAELLAGRRVALEAAGRAGVLYPLVRGSRPAAIEVSYPLEVRRAFVLRSMRDQLVAGLAALLIAGILVYLVLLRYHRAPLNRLLAQVRAAGLPRPLLPPPDETDELGELTYELESLGERHAAAKSRVAREARLQLAEREELQSANRLATLGKLAASLAHELGTPLAVVQARAQMIADTVEGDALADAQVIVDEVRRMTEMCREVLDRARARSPLLQVLDPVEICRKCVTMLQPEARKQGVQLVLEPPPARLRVRADAWRLIQVLTNLLINATQAMERPGAVQITVGEEKTVGPSDLPPAAAWVAIKVRDEGVGIAPENLPFIFETFFTTRQESDGTGIGLAVARRIVREHDGWIGVESEAGAGSEFAVYLPSLPPDEPDPP